MYAFIILLLQVSCDLLEAILDKKQQEPYVLIVGHVQDAQQAFIVVDGEILCEVDVNDCVLALMSVFFVFNICYMKGVSNLFTFLEVVVLNMTCKLPPSVNHFLSALKTN